MTTPALGAIFGQIMLSTEIPSQKIAQIPKINIIGKDLIEFIGIPVRWTLLIADICVAC
jgi:hypothetical protein